MQHKMYPVFVDNIAKDVRTSDLRGVFNKHGDVVEVTIVSDHGFVIFSTPDDALNAIKKVHGYELNGQRLKVDVSKELEDYLDGSDPKDYADETRSHNRPRNNYDRDNFRGGRGGRDRGRRGWVHRGGRGRGFRGRGRRGYGRYSPNSRNDRRSRSPRDGDSYSYHSERNRSPASRRYSMGDEKRRSFSPMVKTYPPDDDSWHHAYRGGRGSRGKKPSPPRRGQNIFPSRESISPSPRRPTSRSKSPSQSRHDSSGSYRKRQSRRRSQDTRSRSRSRSKGKIESEVVKPPRSSLESTSEHNGPRMDSFGFFTASNFVETKIDHDKSPCKPPSAASPITSTSVIDTTTTTSLTNDDEAEGENQRKEKPAVTSSKGKSSSCSPLHSGQSFGIKKEEGNDALPNNKNVDKSKKIKKSSKQSSPDKNVDLREILKSKKKKEKNKSVDEAFDLPPVKRRKSSSSSTNAKAHTNIQIKVERESESVRTIMVGSDDKRKQIKVHEEPVMKMEAHNMAKSTLPPPSLRAGMPLTPFGTENVKYDKLDMEKCQKLFVGNLFNPVENEDIEMLLDGYGQVFEIKRYEKHAIVTIECSRERAEEACNELDHNNWMDNWIRVKFNKYPYSKEEANALWKNKQSAGVRNMNRWYAQHDDREEITLHRDRNPSSESTGVQEEREPKKPKTSSKVESESKIAVSNPNSEVEEKLVEEQSMEQDTNVMKTFKNEGGNSNDEEELDFTEKLKRRKSMERKTRSYRVYCATTNKNFMVDMVEVFTKFGAVISNEWDGACIAIDLDSTEKKAVQCILETNKMRYKLQELRVKFKDGTEEDKEEFQELYPAEFRNYPKDLVPTSASQVRPVSTETDNKTTGNKAEELPIGVLPQSSSLGAFGAPGIPNQDMLTSILQKARENMIKNENATNKSSISNSSPPNNTEPLYNAYSISTAPLTEDPQYLSDVEGHIHSVNNKIVLVQFNTGSNWRLAKLSPGTMYVDGKTCLGFLIKNNTFHSWPQVLKEFLYQGAKVKIDVKKMYDDDEINETRELCGESVTYSTPLVWKINTPKPTEKDITVSRVKPKMSVLKGSVTSIYPKWGVIKTSKGEVFFEVNHVYIDNSRLAKHSSLINQIEKGDTLAVQCISIPDYLEMSEIARSAPGFVGRTDTLKFHARLVWHLNAEVDPHIVRDSDTPDFSDINCNFLTTSSTLNKPLPSDRDLANRPTNRGWTGTVEEIHLPAGGVILLDERLGIKPYERYAYFHRSRLYANGSKVSSSTSLDDEIIPGDRVTLDVLENMQPGGVIKKSNAYVGSEAYWVALSVHLNSNERGVRIARSLRMEVVYKNAMFQETTETLKLDLYKKNSLFRKNQKIVRVLLLPEFNSSTTNLNLIRKISLLFIKIQLNLLSIKLVEHIFVILPEVSCLPIYDPKISRNNNWGLFTFVLKIVIMPSVNINIIVFQGLGNIEPPKEGPTSNVGTGRIVHFFAPRESSTDPVASGVAVIDCGEYAGQRVEFESAQCEAFGCSLERADLSQIFNYGR